MLEIVAVKLLAVVTGKNSSIIFPSYISISSLIHSAVPVTELADLVIITSLSDEKTLFLPLMDDENLCHLLIETVPGSSLG